ncbi:hypothetical protein GCM10027446_23080 [Angustibacter peucedani]
MSVPSGWEIERARAERNARGEVTRLEALVKASPLGSARGQRAAAQLGMARHKLRTTLSHRDFVAHLRATNPARYQALVRENGLP